MNILTQIPNWPSGTAKAVLAADRFMIQTTYETFNEYITTNSRSDIFNVTNGEVNVPIA